MKKIRQQLAPLALLLAAACGGSGVHAETTDWYQVEILVFSQQDLFGDENHVTNIDLRYPDNILELTSASDSGSAPDQPGVEVPSSVTNHAISGEAFHDLANNLLKMTDEHRRLDRAPGYRVLYHKAWRQPGLGTAEAPWVLVQGGETYGDHHELEGSVRLVRNRYLHIQANLWKTKFGQVLPSSTLTITPPINSNKNSTTDYQPTPAPTEQGHEADTSAWPPLPPLPRSQFAPSTAEPGSTISTSGRKEATKYRVNDIVTLKQTSRVSRQEYTYLDHPNMGVIVYVSKHEP